MRTRYLLVAAVALLCGCEKRPDPDASNPTVSDRPTRAAIDRAADDGTAEDDVPTDAPRATAGTPSGIRYLTDADSDGFARATKPRAFVFPEDHGSHPDYRSEWWYFTGNVFADNGRHYGFEFTVFRYALAGSAPESPSAWSTNQFWMAHLAVTDTQSGRLIAEERLTRGALGLAGADSKPFRVWVEDWSVAGELGVEGRAAIVARAEHVALELALTVLKPPVANGEDGLDPKGPEPGNASYYYSIPRLAVTGRVTVDGRSQNVEGLAWMDREWSTSALSPDLEGWDWFALHLSDGRDLMLYRLRQHDGTASPFSGGSLIDADGHRRALGAEDLQLEALDHWVSNRSGVRYPSGWRLRLPTENLELDVQPYIEDQEIDLSVRYWEGAVRFEGHADDRPISGNGYAELAGY